MALAAAAGYIYFGMIIALMMAHMMSKNEAVLSFTLQGVAALVGRILGSAWVHFNDHHIPNHLRKLPNCWHVIPGAEISVYLTRQVVSILCQSPPFTPRREYGCRRVEWNFFRFNGSLHYLCLRLRAPPNGHWLHQFLQRRRRPNTAEGAQM